ncbi:cell surface protein [Arcticibacterium luteifluviistationis]|uniref:Cell surface protein n=1 Tax=Arcticibacterium luteifluviistationis TaxID=1784714 RepID=A0A2Z4GF80_9BACT|nr:cell surface protein [Arcticibacterium luteifluviistationis]AWW00033.1 cell surface protein [Arcticibacterium luteifluviistationis]
MKRLHIILMGVLAFSCNAPDKETITNPSDYNQYLTSNLENEKLAFVKGELIFWSDKFQKAPNQSTYLSKMAAANNEIFALTGQIENLNTAANQFAKVNEMRSTKSASVLRSLAKTRITQHQFQEANQALILADSLGENKSATQKMIFDVAMELGEYDKAGTILKKLSEKEDFDYLIRLAKWRDYNGDTEGAIEQLRLATMKAEELNSDELRLWIYSNLADFYGHVGSIDKSYAHYLKALEIDPNYVYALKGIAWITFSHEKNTEEAERIIAAIEKKHEAPDYNLLKAEIAKYKGNTTKETELEERFISIVSSPKYGDMYNAYLVTMLENEPEKALELAKKEVANRPTPQSYQLLSSAYYQNGNKSEALLIADNKVKGKTYEPKSLIHLAQVYKASGNEENVMDLKNELKGSYFEVGPNMTTIIKNL